MIYNQVQTTHIPTRACASWRRCSSRQLQRLSDTPLQYCPPAETSQYYQGTIGLLSLFGHLLVSEGGFPLPSLLALPVLLLPVWPSHSDPLHIPRPPFPNPGELQTIQHNCKHEQHDPKQGEITAEGQKSCFQQLLLTPGPRLLWRNEGCRCLCSP